MDCIIRRAEQRDADAIAMLYRTALGYAEMTGEAVPLDITPVRHVYAPFVSRF